MPINPEELRPAVDVLMRIGHLDVARPAISYGLIHESAIPISANSLTSTTRNELGTEIKIETARDRAKRTRFRFGYQPVLSRYLKFTQLNTLNHRALLSIIIPFRRTTIGFATTYDKSNSPTLVLGGNSESTNLGSTLRFDTDLSDNFHFKDNLSANYKHTSLHIQQPNPHR